MGRFRNHPKFDGIFLLDHGQQIYTKNLEVLRELLNFETNDQKLLQIVIFAQNEFEKSLNKVKNLEMSIRFNF